MRWSRATDARGGGTSVGMRMGAAAVATVIVVGALGCGGGGGELPVYWDAPEFALVDQRGDTVRTSDLRGAPWVASFVFTSCTGVCPTITQRMALLRDRLDDAGTLGREVRLVSFSIDPERDTPAVLREYASAYGGSPPAEWAFLTGYDGPAARRMVEEGFRLTARPPEGADTRSDEADHHDPGGYQIMHSPRLVLIDAAGAVRGTYDATEPGVIDEVLDDLPALLR